MSTQKRKRQTISIEFKKKVIDESETHPAKSLQALADQFTTDKLKLTRSNVQTILDGKQKVLDALDKGIAGKRARLKPAKYEDLEEAVLMWFKQVRTQNVAVDGPTLKEKARELAEKLKIDDFKASDHWLENFKARHSIKFRTEQGEAAAVDLNKFEDWRNKVLTESLLKYSADDVFNADETGLFWKLMPNKTLAFKGEKCTGGKKSKERVTVLIGSNASGTEKLPLFVIGKSAKPRCFKGRTIPVEYAANEKAWMTGQLFEGWLRKWDNKLKRDGRKVILFLDNCTAHSKIKLQNIELKLLPPNTTAVSQPMDQGIIQNLKVHYRKRLLRRRILAIDSKSEFSLTLLDAIYLLKRAWENVTPTTLANCFRKAGFIFEDQGEFANDETEDEDLKLYWEKLREQNEVEIDLEIADYLTADDRVLTSDALTLDEIAQAVSRSNFAETDQQSGEEIAEVEEPTPITAKDARQGFLMFRQYFEENALDSTLLPTLDRFEDLLAKDQLAKMKQPTLFDYFTRQ